MVADLAKAHNLHPVKGKGVWKRHEMQQCGLVNNSVETWNYDVKKPQHFFHCLVPHPLTYLDLEKYLYN